MDKWNLIIYAPAYNVDKSIGVFLERMDAIRDRLAGKSIAVCDLFIVNDGSTDNTVREIMESGAMKKKYVKIIDHKKNSGVVRALFTAMSFVKKRIGKNPSNIIIVRMDADMEHDPLAIDRLIAPIVSGKSDIVFGVMDFSGYQEEVKKFNRKAGLEESREFLKMDIPQFCPGFQAIRGDFFMKIASELSSAQGRFRRKYGLDMVTMDLVTLFIAKTNMARLEPLKLAKVPQKWIRAQLKEKTARYLDYHRKTMEFLSKY